MLKNVTLSADDRLIRDARARASREHTTLNAVFQDWLGWYAGHGRRDTDYREFMEQLSYADAERSFSRDELNEK